MALKPIALPSDLASAYMALLAEREALQVERDLAVAQAAGAQAKLSETEALIAYLQLMIEKLRREKYGQRSERTARLIEQMELQLDELVTAASEDELAAAAAAAKSGNVRSFTRKRPVRKPWPEDSERERVVIASPTACTCCGGSRLSKLSEDVTETLEEIPRRFKLIETVREKFSCRDCGKVSQPPAPFHATPRGFIGPHGPFAGPAPPATVYYASGDRRGEHPQKHLAGFTGILQCDRYGGFEPLFDPQRNEQPITPAFCFAHARRGFFELADIAKKARDGVKGKPISPIALEAVRRLDALFEIERAISGKPATAWQTGRQEKSKLLLDDMQAWLLRERETLSRSAEALKPINYMLRRWDDFARFLDDGRICFSNSAAERALRGIALGRRSWTFAGSQRGADRAAVMLTLIITARLNDVDPKAWPDDVLARIADLPAARVCASCCPESGNACAKPNSLRISRPPDPRDPLA